MAISDIDHVLTYVHDGEAAELFFRRLGFVVTPVSHITTMGIVNRLILFRDSNPGAANFIELMAVSDHAKLPPAMAAVLQGAEGIKSIVLATDDITAAQRHLVNLGHAVGQPVRVEREWALGDGTSVYPKFDVLLPVDAGLTFNACRYMTPDLYKRADWITHPNTVTGLTAVMAVSERPADIAQRFGDIFNVAPRQEHGAHIVTAGRVALEIYDPRSYHEAFGYAVEPPAGRASFAGYRLVAEDLDALRQIAAQHGVPITDTGVRILIAPDVAPGRLIEVVGP